MDGSVSFIGSLSGSIDTGGGGGSNVSITPILESGTKIAEYTIDDENGELYAPDDVIDVRVRDSQSSEYQSVVNNAKIALIDLISYVRRNELNQELITLENDFDLKLTLKQNNLIAGANISIIDDVISASGGSSWDYSTSEVNTGQKWIDGKDIYCRVFNISPLTMSTGGTWYSTGCVIPNIDTLINVICSGGNDTSYGSITADYSNDNINLINFRIAIVDTITAFYTKSV